MLDQIIASHLKAIGGKEKIKSIKTVVVKGSYAMSIPPDTGKVVLNSLTRITNGKGYRKDTDAGADGSTSFSQTECFTDNTGSVSGWTTAPPLPGMNEMMNGQSETETGTKPREMSEYEYNYGKDQIYIASPFINYPSSEIVIKFVKKFNGQYCILVNIGLVIRFYYLDINTFYVSRIEESGMMGIKTVTIFEDYKNVSGIVFPHSVTTNGYYPKGMGDMLMGHGGTDFLDDPLSVKPKKDEKPDMVITTTVKSIEINQAIDNTIYNFPQN
ncbi:hypothetical protein DC498_18850 [Terrimonas sp.]|nr:hypothetical protein DC498_18850 [Terrimonas sp.]